ncbi:MAG: hypothetical protein WDZ41_05400 [Candidatus Babeliales bacterium]
MKKLKIVILIFSIALFQAACATWSDCFNIKKPTQSIMQNPEIKTAFVASIMSSLMTAVLIKSIENEPNNFMHSNYQKIKRILKKFWDLKTVKTARQFSSNTVYTFGFLFHVLSWRTFADYFFDWGEVRQASHKLNISEEKIVLKGFVYALMCYCASKALEVEEENEKKEYNA